MKKWKILLTVMMIAVCLTGCNKDIGTEGEITPGNSEDKVKEANSNMKSSDVMNMAIIPEEYKYMFDSFVCEGSLPENTQIKRIALTKYNKPQGNSGAWLVLFAMADCEKNKLIYGKSPKPDSVSIVQEIELSGDEVKNYQNALNTSCLSKPIDNDNAYWKIAIEYNDGTCYSYGFEKECYMDGSSENNMIKAYFDKMELKTSERKIAAIWTPETEERTGTASE